MPEGERGTRVVATTFHHHMSGADVYLLNHYNFARIHKTLRITPAMAAGISDHVWSLEEIVGLLDAADRRAA